ncbi:UNVERIFIED_ORG: glucan phosphoethanolaminetransferase (alkaline phosphatase superfamily) [Arthrobacter sp. UYCu721]
MMGRMRTHPQETPGKKANWAARIILGAVALVVLSITYFAFAAILPVWWANVIRNQVQGNLGAGILVGMFYGFVFTFVPLLVAWQAMRKAVIWPWKLVILVAAVALASPNLLTAGIMFGSSQAAHNGQRILGTEATWFPLWTQIGAIAAAVIFVVGVVLWRIWRQRGRKMKALKKVDAERSMAAKAAKDQAANSPVPEAPAATDSQADRR